MLKLFSNIYGCFADRRNRKFDAGDFPIHRCTIPVISVGNISAGGTGKTPLTALIADFLIVNGYKPGIISRGYKGKFKGSLVVSDGTNILCSASESGDEMYMLAKNIKTPILVNQKKYLAAKDIESKFNLDCIIVDDGFQHRFLHRDLDIIIIDKSTLDNPYPFPKGRLREPFANIRRADIICYPNNIANAMNNLECNGLKVELNTNELGLIPLVTIPNANIQNSVFLFSGIANHSKFRNSILNCGNEIISEEIFKDHHSYTESDIKSLIQSFDSNISNTIITTEKDAVKLDKYFHLFAENNLNLLYLKIGSVVSTNSDLFYKRILSTVRANKSK